MNYSTNQSSSSIDSVQFSDFYPDGTLLLPGHPGFRQLGLPKVVDEPRLHAKAKLTPESCILVEGCLTGKDDTGYALSAVLSCIKTAAPHLCSRIYQLGNSGFTFTSRSSVTTALTADVTCRIYQTLRPRVI